MRILLRRHGVLKMTVITTLTAILLSMGITATIDFVTDGSFTNTAILPSVIAPAIIALMKECLERAIDKISEIQIRADSDFRPKVSIGAYTFSSNSNTLDRILQKADMALSKAKQTGGNKII